MISWWRLLHESISLWSGGRQENWSVLPRGHRQEQLTPLWQRQRGTGASLHNRPSSTTGGLFLPFPAVNHPPQCKWCVSTGAVSQVPRAENSNVCLFFAVELEEWLGAGQGRPIIADNTRGRVISSEGCWTAASHEIFISLSVPFQREKQPHLLSVGDVRAGVK